MNGTQHQYGFARVPAILRDSEYDQRKISIMSGMGQDPDFWFNANMTELVESSGGNLEFFEYSSCIGETGTTGALSLSNLGKYSLLLYFNFK